MRKASGAAPLATPSRQSREGNQNITEGRRRGGAFLGSVGAAEIGHYARAASFFVPTSLKGDRGQPLAARPPRQFGRSRLPYITQPRRLARQMPVMSLLDAAGPAFCGQKPAPGAVGV